MGYEWLAVAMLVGFLILLSGYPVASLPAPASSWLIGLAVGAST